MSQASQVSDNEPLKPQELGSKVKVKKPSQKELFAEAAARKAGAAAVAEWRKKCEAEEEAKAAERRRIEKEKEKERQREERLQAKAKVNVEYVAVGDVKRKTLEDFLPQIASEGNATITAAMEISDFRNGEEQKAEYDRLLNESRKKMSNYSARLNKMNSIDEANAKYMESMSKTFGYKQTATLGGKFAGKTR
jgi:hypothetical protein